MPTEQLVPTTRTDAVLTGENEGILAREKVILDDKREQALQHLLRCQESIKIGYDKRVVKRKFNPGDWVMRKVKVFLL